MERAKLTQYYIGNSIVEELKKDIENYDKILIISGDKSYKAIEDKIKLVVGNKVVIHCKYNGECSYQNIEKIEKNIENEKVDLILGIGGGKALDVAKYVAFVKKIPIFTIPTLASTCAGTSKISVIYDEKGKFVEFIEFDEPPIKTFIDLECIKKAPKRYIWAGLGDTLAKYYEVNLNCSLLKGELGYKNYLGREISNLCKELVIRYGEQCLKSDEIDLAFKESVLGIIVNTGYVSLLIDANLNGAIAHSICYSLGIIDKIEENHLHGELVAYGILIQLLVEGKEEEYEKLKSFYKKVDLPTKIDRFGERKTFEEKISEVIKFFYNSPDIKNLMGNGFIVEEKRLVEALLR